MKMLTVRIVTSALIAMSLVGLARDANARTGSRTRSTQEPKSAGEPIHPAPTASRDASAYEQKAKQLFAEGRFAEAATEFEEAYAISKDPAFLYNMALCHRKLGHAGRALGLFEDYLRAVPDSPQRATVETRIAELRQALAPVQPPAQAPAARQQSQDGFAHEQDAKRWYEAGRFAEAAVEFEKAYTTSGDPAFLYNMALCHRKLGHSDKALGLLEQYLRAVPDSPQRPAVEARIRELRAAQAPTAPNGDAVEEHPGDAHWHEQRAKQGYERGQWAEAAAEFEKAYAISGDPALLYNRGLCYRKLGDPERELGLFQDYLRMAPDSPQRPAVEARIQELQRTQGRAVAATDGTNRIPATPSQAASTSSNDDIPVAFEVAAWSGEFQVSVIRPGGNSLRCSAPCTLSLPRGESNVVISGDTNFAKPIFVSPASQRFSIHRERVGQGIAGKVIMGVGLLSMSITGIVGKDMGFYPLLGALVGDSIIFGIGAIVSATRGTNELTLAQTHSATGGGPRFLGLGVSLPSRSAGIVGASFAF